jgi:soluble lytic murein transglycosylase-like protein
MAHTLNLRHHDRRHADDRRHVDRAAHERRRADRRRRTLRSLVFGVFAIALPKHVGLLRVTPAMAEPVGVISVSEDYRPIPATIAYDDMIADAASQYHLDPNLIRAVIHAESAFNPFAVSGAGAQGLMQLMPEVAAELGVDNAFDPRQNILAGARYLRDLLDRHHGNIDLAVASYNAGPGAVKRYRGIPPYRETRNYVKTVKTYMKQPHETDGD